MFSPCSVSGVGAETQSQLSRSSQCKGEQMGWPWHCFMINSVINVSSGLGHSVWEVASKKGQRRVSWRTGVLSVLSGQKNFEHCERWDQNLILCGGSKSLIHLLVGRVWGEATVRVAVGEIGGGQSWWPQPAVSRYPGFVQKLFLGVSWMKYELVRTQCRDTMCYCWCQGS